MKTKWIIFVWIIGACCVMPWNPDGLRWVVDLSWHIFTFPLSRKQCLRRREFVSLLSDEKEKIICVRDGELCIMLAGLTESFVKEKPNELQVQLSPCRLIERRRFWPFENAKSLIWRLRSSPSNKVGTSWINSIEVFSVLQPEEIEDCLV